MRQRTGKTSNRDPAAPLTAPGGRSKGPEGRGDGHCQSLLVFGACLWSGTQLQPRCLPWLRARALPASMAVSPGPAARRRHGGRCWCPPRLYGPGAGASAVRGQPGTGLACSRSGSVRVAHLAGGLGDGGGTAPGRILPGRARGLRGPAELTPIDSCAPIVIPDHKAPGGSRAAEPPPDTRQASLRSPCLS